MSANMSAKEISEAWLAFVSDTFMTGEGSSSSQEGDEMLRQLVESEKLQYARETWRVGTDKLIEEILAGTPETRRDILSNMNPTAMALVQDRIQCVTEVMIGLTQKSLQITAEAGPAMTAFFRQMLLQKPEPAKQEPKWETKSNGPEGMNADQI
jgi:hypothetical protein